jgi:hypothetical protein
MLSVNKISSGEQDDWIDYRDGGSDYGGGKSERRYDDD